MAAIRFSLINIVFICFVTSSLDKCLGELFITHSPSNTEFLKNDDSIELSEIPKVVVSSFGFGLSQDLKWKALTQKNVFRRPKAHCVVSVEGVPDGAITPVHTASYQVTNDVGAVDTGSVGHKLLGAGYHKSLVVDFSQYTRIYDVISQYPDIMKEVPTSLVNAQAILTNGSPGLLSMDFRSLNVSEDIDLAFLTEVLVLRSVINSLKSNPEVAEDSHPDFLHFKVTTFPKLFARYGEKSEKVQDAQAILTQVLDQLTSDLCALYSDNVVVQVVTFSHSPDSLHRNVRSLLQDQADDKPATKSLEQSLNLGKKYDDNYSVYFNIILWLVIVLILAILFVSYGVWFMDPGRDSIIYRMTSQRLKRD